MNISITHKVSIAILTIFILLLSSCGGKSNDATEPFVFDPLFDQFDPNAINIGSIVNAPSPRNAILLAVNQVNEAGGVLGKKLNSVALLASSTKDAVAQAKKLLEQDIKVISVSFSSRSKAVSQLTIPQQIPLISESATSPFFTHFNDNDFYFRMVPSDIIQSRILAELAIQQGYKTAVTAHNDTDQYGETLVEYFTQNFEQLGGKVLAQIAVPFTVNAGFDLFLQTIIDNNPDMVLGAILEADESANFFNEAIAFGIQAKFLFPDASTGVTAFSNNIANVTSIKDSLGTAPGFGFATNPEMMFFDSSYRQQFNHAPDGFDVSGYDFAMVTALAIEHAGLANNTNNPTGLMIRNSLRAVMNPPGQIVGPANIAEALQLLRDGKDIDYSGSYGANNWDENGDITGEITYNIMEIDSETKKWKTVFQQQISIEQNQ